MLYSKTKDILFNIEDVDFQDLELQNILPLIEPRLDSLLYSLRIYQKALDRNLNKTARFYLSVGLLDLYEVNTFFYICYCKINSLEVSELNLDRLEEKLKDVIKSKNTDYGSSFDKVITKMKDEGNMVVRLYDKYFRLKQLISTEKQLVKEESIKDTILDALGYCQLCYKRIDNLGGRLI